MLSTYQSYQFYSRNPAQSLARTAGEATVKSDRTYYLANIGKVKTVDDLLKDYRLFSTVMKAYGLEDMTYAKGFIKKVLTSDLNDTSSFANKLNDARYKALAQAFNFTAKGTLTSAAAVQSTDQGNDTAGLYSKAIASNYDAASTEANYMAGAAASAATVDDITGDARLVKDLLQAYGLDPATDTATLKAALESDPGDASSFVNQPGQPAGLKALAQDFNVDAGGAVTAQSSTQASDMRARFVVSGSTSTEGIYIKGALAAATNVDQILGNPRLVNDLITAYGLDPDTSSVTLRAALESDETDSSSFVNQAGQPSGLKALAKDFNVTAAGAVSAQSVSQSNSTLMKFASVSSFSVEASYAKAALAKLTSADDLVSNRRLLGDVMTAYGLDGSVDAHTIETALESDTSDPASLVNATGQPAGLKALAADFNFSAAGSVTTQRLVQSEKNFKAMAAAYAAAVGTDSASKSAATAESTYVGTLISKATSLGDLLADTRVVAYIGKAFGVGTISPSTLKAVLTSDLADPKSKANTLGPAYGRMAAAFAFTKSGTVAREPALAAQSKSQIFATTAAYLQQTMESEAGADNEGVRLALYFKRMAPTITSAFSVLADKALLKVVQTVLNLPASSKADIDTQAKQITDKIKISDLRDPKKLERLMERFTTLYDIQNNTSATDKVSLLFGGGSGDTSTTSSTVGLLGG